MDETAADLADAVLALAQHLEMRGPASGHAVQLTHTEITVIREIHREPGATATRLAAMTGLQRSNVSAVAHALEERDLLERVSPPSGGRGVGFAPSDLAHENYARLRAHWADLLHGAPPEVLAAAAEAGPALAALSRSLRR
ncbi:MarR family winged helix-turn-helix transcriptional regulator [Demequina sp. NBRC 110057]|uniref:MarR family winged helix-turn-helix transcriptional regulator n=1 Tax=Demequina sp. NBRC 110057 TaxID=1570346 RepID=UPI0009FC270E|nr:helix-turn-helix domain-containing protein [Demequina sp. NBRC 110057]